MPRRQRLIAHLDMDAFYASVELLRYPDLRGQPVVIGGGRDHRPVPQADGSCRYARLRDYAGRGVITTATYEARALGAHSGMGVMKAAQLTPDAVLLPVDFDEYRKYSRLFKAAVREIAPLVEDRGIDEIYIDLSDLPGAQDDAGRGVAQALKDAVHRATGLGCSIGVTPNKLLSKICSDLDKPDGLTLLAEQDIPTRIWPLAAKKINGIGPKATQRLAEFDIHTIGDLAGADPAFLIANFGKSYGAWLHEAAHGRDERPVVTYSEPKSISRETTFERDLHAVRDRATLGSIFTELCIELAGDLVRKGYASKTIGIKLRFDDFKIVTRDLTLPAHTMDAHCIRRAAGECLKRVDLTRRLRLLGVRAGTLAKLSDLVSPSTAYAAAEPSRPLVAEEAPSPHGLPLFDAADERERSDEQVERAPRYIGSSISLLHLIPGDCDMSRVSTYLNFERSTEQAFQFYRSVFGGDFTGGVHRFADIPASPGQPSLPEADKQLVMHIELPILGGHVLMGTDAPQSMGFSLTAGNNVHINLEPDTRGETQRLFEALAKDGKVDMPLEDMFWGALFGSLTDKFGIHWMFNCSNKN